MDIELTRETRAEAIQSIQQYFLKTLDQEIGNLAAGALLDFFIEEVGPVVYNSAVADVQKRLQPRIEELDAEMHQDELQYWRRLNRKK